ncbi:uncharacterized protein LOC119601875 [Lucilia sericata]|uniref:uncharacterized protein LOC119601875 n=1 Tax=Lucilia sericata TaxID=13632 RepID=UPI0018A88181|nr:uncharacterized protein LOC119601875 [Lucilia sericata]
MDVSQRYENAKRLSLCLNCLSKGHQVSSCSSTFKCKFCSRSHHSLLHRSQPASRPSSPAAEPTTSHVALNESSASVHTHMEKSSPELVLLATAMVLVRDSTGRYQLGRALLDSCSQLNFITDEFSQKLHLPRTKQTTEVSSIGNTLSKSKYRSSTNVKSRVTDFEVSLSFCVTPHISYQPDNELDVSSWNLPPNTELADENFFKSKRIDLLIGTETFFDILAVGQIKLGPNLPKLHKTLFGWIVAGRYVSKQPNICGSSCMLSIEEDIDLKLQRLWEIDEVQSGSNDLTPEQSECETFFNDTVHRESSGRIVVKLPFKESPDALGLSRNMALKRFVSQERRFARDSNLKSQYVAFMKEYEDFGHMSLVRSPRLHEPHYFIPYHCVFKPSSTSTKLRVVFDASCPSSSQKSLNDLLMPQELENAKLCIVFNIQKLHFQDDITRALKKKDPQGALKCLNPFLDSSNGFNLLKVGGRLEAPHFGGLWEAAVKSAKGHLTRTLDNTRLTYEELATAMIEIEAVLNSRPISPLSSDPSDFEALTPGHFLIGAPLRSLPERDVPTNEINKLEYWARLYK